MNLATMERRADGVSRLRRRSFAVADEPLGYVDGPNVYGVERANPVGATDPMGQDVAPPSKDIDRRPIPNTADDRYNCVGYARYLVYGGIADWDDDINSLLRDTDMLDAHAPNKVGDIIVYGSGHKAPFKPGTWDHVGVVTAVDNNGRIMEVTAKEGSQGIVRHDPWGRNILFSTNMTLFRLRNGEPTLSNPVPGEEDIHDNGRGPRYPTTQPTTKPTTKPVK